MTLREQLIEKIKLRLGSGMVELFPDPEHYNLAVEMAFQKYRQRSTNSRAEGFLLIEVDKDASTYQLPMEVAEVRDAVRRGIGGIGGGVQFDPFSLAFVNNIYLLQNPGNLSTGGAGTLATYDFAMQFQELAGRMFGRDLVYHFDNVSKKISFHRNFTAKETILLWLYVHKTEESLLVDPYASIWLFDYSVACAKLILGEAYEMFSQIPGPGGSFNLNGSNLKAEGQASRDALELELFNNVEQEMGYGFVIG